MAKAQGEGSIRNDPNRPLTLVRTELHPNGVLRNTSIGATNTEAELTLTTETAVLPPFVWDNDHENNEQVRPYYAAYLVERERVIAAHGFPRIYAFKGSIPELEGPNEETAIYMLGVMHDLDEVKVKVDEFVAAGAVDAGTLERGREYRGTVARHGWHMGGAGGWTMFESARVVSYGADQVLVTEKGKKQGYIQMNAKTLFIPDPPKSRKSTA